VLNSVLEVTLSTHGASRFIAFTARVTIFDDFSMGHGVHAVIAETFRENDRSSDPSVLLTYEQKAMTW